ncbi:MAG TPA: hypothetical protein VD866_17695 [Urbifossiella sp.]|nr:hypothetical protein [Urbifossiella sp.]
MGVALFMTSAFAVGLLIVFLVVVADKTEEIEKLKQQLHEANMRMGGLQTPIASQPPKQAGAVITISPAPDGPPPTVTVHDASPPVPAPPTVTVPTSPSAPPLPKSMRRRPTP